VKNKHKSAEEVNADHMMLLLLFFFDNVNSRWK